MKIFPLQDIETTIFTKDTLIIIKIHNLVCTLDICVSESCPIKVGRNILSNFSHIL